MTFVGWLEIALVLGAVLATAWPLGGYMARVFAGERTMLSGLLVPVERRLYATADVKQEREQDWLGYTMCMLGLNAAGFVLLYGLMRFQGILPLDPQGFAGIAPDLAYNIAISFVSSKRARSRAATYA